MPAAFLLWPLTLNRFLFSDRSCTVFPASSCTYTFNLREKWEKRKDLVWLKQKNNNFIWPRMRGKKYATRSRTIFPLTHGPVQVVCSPQSIIFTAVTDGRKADCNYSYRYWGHLEVVSPHWKTELLHSHKGQVFITSSPARLHRQTLVSNWMHRHKEATTGHICVWK